MARVPRHPRPIVLVLAVVAVALGPALPVAAADPRLADPHLSLPVSTASGDELPPETADQMVIRYRSTATPAQRRAVASAHGLTPVRLSSDGRTEVALAKGRSPAAARRDLAADPMVVAVAPNHQRELAEDISDEPEFESLWGLHNTGQTISGTSTQTGTSGVDLDALEALDSGLGSSSVVVAVIDDGIDFSHPDLAARAWTNPGESGGGRETNGVDDDDNGFIDDVHGWDFCNDDKTVHDGGQDWHGTHVAGTIAASLDGQGVVGVAPGVRLMALKFIDNSGACGFDDLAVDAIDYAASFGVRIINASWGGPEPSTVLDAAIVDSHALFVAAAGNSGSNMDARGGQRFYPAASTAPGVVSVAAVDQTGRLPSFSNYGATSVDIAAPGTNILSTYPAGGGCSGACYAWSAGTSMAAPHVSGVAALVGSRNPSLLATPTSLRARILATGKPLASNAGRTATGRLVNALRAIDAVRPTVHAPDRFGVSVGSTITSRRVRAVVRWPAATDDVSGVARYAIRRHGPGGWSTVTAGTGERFVRSTLRFGSSYTFRLRAHDRAGNVGGPVDSATIRASLHQDGSSLARYSGSWRVVRSDGASGGRYHRSSKVGAWAEFRFTGRGFGLVTPVGPSRGRVAIYVDGVPVETVSLRRANNDSRRVVFSHAWSSSGPHTIRFVIASGKVDLDAFVAIR
jgi:subtilisin family serine protease